MAKRKYYWDYGVNDGVSYVKCSSCNHKLSAKKFIMGDKDLTACPWCGKTMDFTRIDYGKLSDAAAVEGV